MNVFISYSVADTTLVSNIADYLSGDATVKYWNQDKEPGYEAWQTIFSWIDASDMVLVVITDSTLRRAMSVGQEIGRAGQMGKFIVPLIQRGIPATEIGALATTTRIELDPRNIAGAAEQARLSVLRMKADKQDQAAALLMLGGILGLIWLSTRKSK